MYHVLLFGKGPPGHARLLDLTAPKSPEEKGNRASSRDAASCFVDSVEEPLYDSSSQRMQSTVFRGENKDKEHF